MVPGVSRFSDTSAWFVDTTTITNRIVLNLPASYGFASPWPARDLEDERRRSEHQSRKAGRSEMGVPPVDLDLSTLALPALPARQIDLTPRVLRTLMRPRYAAKQRRPLRSRPGRSSLRVRASAS